MKVAIVHYWLLRMRGGEKVVEALCEMYPEADLFTHVVDRPALSNTIAERTIHTTFISKLPLAKRWYKNYLPFMPLALEQLDLSSYDLVISTESGPAKGVLTAPHTLHICYCHTPMRYAWDMYHDYLNGQFFLKRWMMRPLLHYIRNWDFISAARVDYFVANSQFVAKRISKYYRRQAAVINPPVDTHRFEIKDSKQNYYLLLGQLVAYKRADIAIEAFNQSGRKLLVIGDGETSKELAALANDNIEFLGWVDANVIEQHLSNCKALIFPGIEDFGIVPLEAMASGTPVIAYAKGGALETIKAQETGVFFDEQTAQSLNNAINDFEQSEQSFDAKAIKTHAESFSKERFKQQMAEFVERSLADFS